VTSKYYVIDAEKLPMMIEKNITPKRNSMIIMERSQSLYGRKSPKPTVVSVVKAKYIVAIVPYTGFSSVRPFTLLKLL